ncbi:hypothetical protein F5Y12DRAFT_791910 [Xylaria sp. FL1777]|nr:hypothetical protein F5Y12DRAFT_791910 [Xylaria sp. FL1777]
MDGINEPTSRITCLPNELQIGIFCEMADMDSVRSLATAYPHCKSVFLLNEKRITSAVYINKACQIAEELTGVHCFEFVKLGLLIICYEARTLDVDWDWMLKYLSNEKLPPDSDPSTLECKWEEFKLAMISFRVSFRARAQLHRIVSLVDKNLGTISETSILHLLWLFFSDPSGGPPRTHGSHDPRIRRQRRVGKSFVEGIAALHKYVRLILVYGETIATVLSQR